VEEEGKRAALPTWCKRAPVTRKKREVELFVALATKSREKNNKKRKGLKRVEQEQRLLLGVKKGGRPDLCQSTEAAEKKKSQRDPNRLPKNHLKKRRKGPMYLFANGCRIRKIRESRAKTAGVRLPRRIHPGAYVQKGAKVKRLANKNKPSSRD